MATTINFVDTTINCLGDKVGRHRMCGAVRAAPNIGFFEHGSLPHKSSATQCMLRFQHVLIAFCLALAARALMCCQRLEAGAQGGASIRFLITCHRLPPL